MQSMEKLRMAREAEEVSACLGSNSKLTEWIVTAVFCRYYAFVATHCNSLREVFNLLCHFVHVLQSVCASSSTASSCAVSKCAILGYARWRQKIF